MLLPFLINLLITALVVFLCAKYMSGVTVKNFWSAIVVALVLAGLNALLSIFLPTLISSKGTGDILGFVIGLAVDTGLIMLADRIVDNFKVQSWKWALAVAVVSMLVSSILGGVLS